MTNTIKNTHRSENDIHFKSRRNNPSCIFTKDKCKIKIFKETITVSNNCCIFYPFSQRNSQLENNKILKGILLGI